MTAAGDAQVFDDLRLTAGRSVRCLRYGNSRQTRHLDQTRRIVCAGQHRRSRADRQLQPLQEAAERLGWSIVGVYRDEGISGARGRDKRPGLDALLKGVSWREFDIVAAW
jgi:hypothetical protein